MKKEKYKDLNTEQIKFTWENEEGLLRFVVARRNFNYGKHKNAWSPWEIVIPNTLSAQDIEKVQKSLEMIKKEI